ncbi:16S rRNA (adenine(1518)-N(6)/adenine(1519)-N(6))-dimethyltransferase RsmA [Rhodocyclus tenuis]|uniref:16S rRNA (adenine(1518)-N(6)/adenine(1519)-N(6))- dimethyltransferase RsmA n=1 Tax=Rhodocyclus gracilis TaxID=2929842 RepID=UPI001298AF4D|nr:16S rRNA (adenine(1518)-N(6)/adenine(1519)-N(6))-dimethyltransferase RsmA [Rhodocyclus gracilis]MRD72232.1 16S rRNA (adenine(1518)-N(6)/adenine(1519)-N(6))-dimethyltransferase RsmA [Rhodocyclus gracilis]
MNGHRARKRFGQNFLVDRGLIGDIINAVAPQAGDCVVEIGPGLGALTAPLLDRLDHLHVVEIDRDLVARMRRRFPAERLSVHEGDALAFDFASLPRPTGVRLKVVGNLPYNISTPLLFHLADAAESVRDMHFMLQREVVERMVAEPGSSDYGRLSVMLGYRFVIDWLLDAPPEAFDPPPKVHSAVVRLIPRPASERQAVDEAVFARVVAAAFAQRRKMLRNTLKAVIPDAGFAALGIDPTRRAEELPISDYVRLANWLVAAGAEASAVARGD